MPLVAGNWEAMRLGSLEVRSAQEKPQAKRHAIRHLSGSAHGADFLKILSLSH